MAWTTLIFLAKTLALIGYRTVFCWINSTNNHLSKLYARMSLLRSCGPSVLTRTERATEERNGGLSCFMCFLHSTYLILPGDCCYAHCSLTHAAWGLVFLWLNLPIKPYQRDGLKMLKTLFQDKLVRDFLSSVAVQMARQQCVSFKESHETNLTRERKMVPGIRWESPAR